MKIAEIDKLIRNDEESCVSIIIPTDRVDKKKNYESLKKAIQKAKGLLEMQRFTIDVKSELGTKIDQLIAQIPVQVSDGLGIFISRTQLAITSFPFPVEQKVKVGKTFEVRDLLYLKQYGLPYYVLNLSKKGVHLFKGEQGRACGVTSLPGSGLSAQFTSALKEILVSKEELLENNASTGYENRFVNCQILGSIASCGIRLVQDDME